ncbi:MAG: hypothetical protein PVF59_10595, partial [Desulfobacterales bacterium]
MRSCIAPAAGECTVLTLAATFMGAPRTADPLTGVIRRSLWFGPPGRIRLRENTAILITIFIRSMFYHRQQLLAGIDDFNQMAVMASLVACRLRLGRRQVIFRQ